MFPGNPVPADIKPFANKHPEMTAKVCALVEFERTEFALKAVKDLNGQEHPAPVKAATEAKDETSEDNKEEEEEKSEEKKMEKMVVMELTAPPPKTVSKALKAGTEATAMSEKKRPTLTLTRAPLNAAAASAQQVNSIHFHAIQSYVGFFLQKCSIRRRRL